MLKIFIYKKNFLILFIFVTFTFIKNEDVFASETRCEDSDVLVEGATSERIDEICLAAKKAIIFLDGIGVPQHGTVKLYVVDQIPVGGSGNLGCYDHRTDRAFIKDIETCAAAYKDVSLFRIPFNEEIHSSFIAHEVAHAIAQKNFAYKSPRIAAHEYIASVVQMATLSEKTRTEILNKFNNVSFSESIEINYLIYLISPAVFIVKSYAHYVREENGSNFIHRLLSGDFKPIELDEQFP